MISACFLVVQRGLRVIRVLVVIWAIMVRRERKGFMMMPTARVMTSRAMDVPLVSDPLNQLVVLRVLLIIRVILQENLNCFSDFIFRVQRGEVQRRHVCIGADTSR